jgi:predicted nucleotidyltransferase
MKEKHPELISLNLFGSFIKGYATSESDLDAYLMIDDGISAQNKTEPAAILDDVKEHIKKELNLTNNQVLAIQLDGWNEERIKKFIEANMTASLSRFFLFSIGKDISNYRKLILDNLELNKVSGPKKWKGIMDSLRIQESIGFSTEVMDRRRKLYPQTLAEGRKYFLRESAAEPT